MYMGVGVRGGVSLDQECNIKNSRECLRLYCLIVNAARSREPCFDLTATLPRTFGGGGVGDMAGGAEGWGGGGGGDRGSQCGLNSKWTLESKRLRGTDG